MPEQDFREIQLSGKQVVFLFMAFLVVGVVVFLLGVSVGRGVRNPPPAPAVAEKDTGVEPPPALPPPTEPAPGELSYTTDLKGGADSSRGSGAATAAKTSPPPATPPPQPKPTSSTAKPAPPPATPSSSAAKPRTAAAPTTGGWTVQVNAFGSRANADRQAGDLKAKGYPAFVFTAPEGGARFRVRVGPYAERSEADRIAARLVKEGFASKPSIIR